MRQLFLPAFALIAALTATTSAQDKLSFNRDIRPILSENCLSCHGPDKNQRKANLRLDQHDSAVGKSESGATAIVPGKLADSELIRRILATNPDEKMPPASTGKKLTPQQIETLKKWVEQGAEYQGHWSFLKPERAAAPKLPDESRVANDIDRFVFSRLAKDGLQPQPEADKVTLIRRVTLDLTGLPPTPAAVDAFIADPAPNAYEKLIDKLLLSSRFGEHMGRNWLDLARYGDTHGLHLDNERSMWKYRDWVINAFNANKPFNEFTVEQLAGDLLPNSTTEQKIATGFVRANVSTSEGGSINDEVLVRYAVDRTETMGTVFMGLTLGCAVCHDHKFDPVSQKEFYQLYAFYNAAADAAMDGYQLAPPPIIKVPDAESETKLKTLDEKLVALRKQLADESAKIDYKEPEAKPAATTSEPKEFVWIEDAAPSGAQLQGDSPWEFVSKPAHPVFSGEKATRRKGAAMSQHFFTGANPTLKVGEGDKFFAYCYLDPTDPPKTVMLQWNDGQWEHRAFWGEDKIAFGTGDVPGHRRMGDLPKLGEWVRLEVDAKHVGLPAGAQLNGWAFTQFGGTLYWDNAGIVTRTPQNGGSFESLAEWEAYEKAIAQSPTPQPVRDAIKVEADKRNDAQKKLIRDRFLAYVYEPTKKILEPLHQQIAASEKERTDTDNAIPVSLVMADMPNPRATHILVRGQYDKLGDKVEANVPGAFPAMLEGAPKNRLGMAQWLTHRDHPLTSRVTVNRFWQQFFGRGIVKTSEDFGSQGEWPTNPELLDWLSVEFMDSGWNVKHLMKQMLLSSAYRQNSNVSPETLAKDPENALVSRGPRFRLDAEVVRDSALFVSGLLVEKVGGRSVRTYQPSNIWEPVAFVGSNTSAYKRDAGEALYRRSMYTFWKRTAPPPSMMAFDAPSRENCIARRARTNTPLQALVLMNDEQYIEAARQLAYRMLKEGGTTPVSRLTFAFRSITGRVPNEKETDVLLKLHDKQVLRFTANKEAAVKLLTVGESKRDESLDPSQHAAFTMMANLILNLDEVVTKE